MKSVHPRGCGYPFQSFLLLSNQLRDFLCWPQMASFMFYSASRMNGNKKKRTDLSIHTNKVDGGERDSPLSEYTDQQLQTLFNKSFPAYLFDRSKSSD